MLAIGANMDTCQKLNNINGSVNVSAAKVSIRASFIAKNSGALLKTFL
jgi:hypothetical protein